MKYTIKEIRKFLRGLEENKYRRRYAIDAKRIHYFANNGVNATLPPSLSRKNESAAYKRDKFLAKDKNIVVNDEKIQQILIDIVSDNSNSKRTGRFGTQLTVIPNATLTAAAHYLRKIAGGTNEGAQAVSATWQAGYFTTA